MILNRNIKASTAIGLLSVYFCVAYKMKCKIKSILFVFIFIGVEDHLMVNSNARSFVSATEISFPGKNNSFDVQLASIDSANLLSAHDSNARSEALIKKIHPFIFPKQFNILDSVANEAPQMDTMTNQNFIDESDEQHMNVTSNMNKINENTDRADNTYDLIPLTMHPHELTKHNSFQNYLNRPFNNPHNIVPITNPINAINPTNTNCVTGLLAGCTSDSLLLLGILAFLAYVINSVISLVDRIGLPLLGPVTSNLSSITTATNALSASNKGLITTRQYVDERFLDNNQNLLRDFERILQMAIDSFERKSGYELN